MKLEAYLIHRQFEGIGARGRRICTSLAGSLRSSEMHRNQEGETR